jgi:hypothetical protein
MVRSDSSPAAGYSHLQSGYNMSEHTFQVQNSQETEIILDPLIDIGDRI